MMRINSLGIYIHVPFCKSKCPYCDFYSVLFKNDENSKEKPYFSAILKQIDAFLKENEEKMPINTIYFGGGTPNLLEIDELSEILDRFAQKSTSNSSEIEKTIEVNPRDIDFEKLKGLKEIGFNRLSLGMQSFDDEILKKLGRRHRLGDNLEAFRMAREAGFDNISIDLMFGIPGQSMDSWKKSVDSALALDPEHISLYSLEFMEGTAFTKMLSEGKMAETEETLDREMYHYALSRFKEKGLEQYEISNVAKPGFESRHNMKYWNLEEYAGFGPSAHSYINHRRYHSVADLELYLKNPTDKIVYEENTPFDDMSEFVFTGLRKMEGVNLYDFYDMFGMDLWAAFEFSKPVFMDFVKEGYCEMTDEYIRLTEKGFDISNRILCLFV